VWSGPIDQLNSVHQTIEFTMEMEIDGHVPFLDLIFTGDKHLNIPQV
jgi:hypothetical protein